MVTTPSFVVATVAFIVNSVPSRSIPAAPAATEAPADVDAATESAEMPEVTLPAEAEEAAEAVVEKAEDVAADITEAAEEATEPAN